MLTQQEILDKLNDEQQIPVKDYLGPQFLVAGPGSGSLHVYILI